MYTIKVIAESYFKDDNGQSYFNACRIFFTFVNKQNCVIIAEVSVETLKLVLLIWKNY